MQNKSSIYESIYDSICDSICEIICKTICESKTILGHLRPSWDHLGTILIILGHLGTILGPSWDHLGASWGVFGPS